jgi:hypothetical protein
MGDRSGRGSRSPIGYANGYQNSNSHAEITIRQNEEMAQFHGHRVETV